MMTTTLIAAGVDTFCGKTRPIMNHLTSTTSAPIVPIVTMTWIKTRVSMTITTSRRPSSTGKGPGSSVWSWKLTVRVNVRIKHDGSLNEGLEIITHPMSLDYHRNKMPWAELCRKATSLGYLSHRTTTCGLHVHVSRKAFGATEQAQDAAIARVLYFFEKHWEELLKFSRRTPRQLERWAARYGYKEQPMEILDFAKKGYHGGRYTCVNLQNTTTVEFRMFRGTLKANTIFATLELLDRICDLAVCLSDEELKAVPWTSFVIGVSTEQYPELVQYLKEQRLYVNEPVEVGVED